MAVKESLKFNWFEIKSNINPEDTIDLRAGTARVEYRESVFSPYIEVTGYLADTGNTVPDKDDENINIQSSNGNTNVAEGLDITPSYGGDGVIEVKKETTYIQPIEV